MLKHKVTVITGGAGGMGLAAAKLLGAERQLLLCDMNQQRLDHAAEELLQLGCHCQTMVCDVTDRDSVNALVQRAQAMGQVSAVIHTAGISPQMAGPEAIMRVNALGTIFIAEAFLAVAVEGFALVNVASMSAHMMPGLLIPERAFRLAGSDPERLLKKAVARAKLIRNDFYRKGLAYGISKSFVIWYSKRSAAAFGAKGARVVSVSPGTFDTEMGRLEEKSGAMKMLDDAALKRPGCPDEIAQVLVFCASEKASYLTGVDVLCDGGVIAGRMSR